MRSSFRVLAATVSASLALLMSGAYAHHSYVSKYDAAKKLTLKGVITSVSYTNPHIFFSIAVAGRSGGTSEWRIETESILLTRGRGLTEAKLAVGKRVVVTGWPARSGSAELGLSTIRIGNGPALSIRTRPR